MYVFLKLFEYLLSCLSHNEQGFLKHEHEMIVLTAIEESKQETMKRIDENYVKSLVDDWEVSKKGMRTRTLNINTRSITLL